MKQLFSILMAGLLIAGCKKSSSSGEDGDYYIKFKVDGSQVEYRKDIMNNGVLFMDAPYQGLYSVSVTGMKDYESMANPDEPSNFIQFTVRDREPIKTGVTYNLQDGVLDNNSFLHAKVLFYFTNENSETYNAITVRAAHPELTILDEATVIFTEINDTYTRGTFTATIVRPGTFTNPKVVTEGEFKLRTMNVGL